MGETIRKWIRKWGEGGLGMVLPDIRRDLLTPLAHLAICHPPAQDHAMHHLTNNY